jgi:hypothetical protein
VSALFTDWRLRELATELEALAGVHIQAVTIEDPGDAFRRTVFRVNATCAENGVRHYIQGGIEFDVAVDPEAAVQIAREWAEDVGARVKYVIRKAAVRS